jgi:hypothetical protein
MDFSDALRAVRSGAKVRRSIWEDGTRLEGAYLRIDILPEPYAPQLMCVYGDTLRSFAGSQWDLLAEDWEIMK